MRASIRHLCHPLRPTRSAERGRDGDYVVTTDPGRVDLDVVHRFLSEESYWALGPHARRTGARERAVDVLHACCTSRPARTVGFARVLTDDVVVRLGGRRLRARRSSWARRRRVPDAVRRRGVRAPRAARARHARRARRVREGRLRAAQPGRALDGALARRRRIPDRRRRSRTSLSHPVGTLGVVQAGPRIVVRRAHAGAAAFVGRGVQRREEREAALDAALAPGRDPAGRRGHAGARRGARSVPPVLRARPRPDQALAPVAPARGQVPGVHRARRRSPPHPAHPRGRGRAGRHRHRPGRRPVRAAHRGDRARARLRPRSRRARLARRRSRRTSPAATTTPSTAPTSRSRRSTSASRRSTACATTRGAGPRRPRPRARWSPGPTASRTSATTSRTRCAPASSSPTTCPTRSRDVVGARAVARRSARSCTRCSTRSTAPAASA